MGAGRQAFVDESFEREDLLAAAMVSAEDVTAARRRIRGLLDKRQRRLHFKDEGEARKRKILDLIAELRPAVRVYATPNRRAARQACLTRLVPDLTAAGVTRLIIERDDSVVEFDRRLLFQLTRTNESEFLYDHRRAHEDFLLCTADAVAWCTAKGGPWWDAVSEFTTRIHV